MNDSLAQTIFAARNGDKGWINVLFIVALGIFYVVGSLLKARSSKLTEQEEEQPAQKPPEGTGRLQRQFVRPVGRAAGPAPGTQPRQPHRKMARPQPKPGLEGLPEFTGKPVRKPEDKHLGIPVPVEIPAARYLSELLSDYANPDELKMAILHYEILGKPLSLRRPSEHIIGL